MDKIIPVPQSMSHYDIHRHISALANGRPVLWAHEGNQVRLRFRDEEVDPTQFKAGQLLCMVMQSNIRTNRGLIQDIRDIPFSVFAKRWLVQRSSKFGFEVQNAHVKSHNVLINKKEGGFKLKVANFSTLIRITDPVLFANALKNGASKASHTYGMGMLVVV